MKDIKRLLIGLDHSEMDKTLIEYTLYFSGFLPVTEIIIVNVIPDLHIPDEVLSEFPDLKEKVISDREEEIRKIVGPYFEEKDLQLQYIIREGVPTKFIMDYSHDHDIDLIIIGRKKMLPTSGVTIPRLARRSDCNLLIVPEGARPSLKTICVPIDFSDYSNLSINHAIDLAVKTTPPIEIVCQHVYNVPTGYTHIGKTYKEFATIMKRNAEKNFKALLKGIDARGTKIRPVFNLESKEDVSAKVCELVDKVKADLLIIGAKGRTATAALFIGTFAEKLIHVIKDTPIFIARPKGQHKGILDYIRGL